MGGVGGNLIASYYCINPFSGRSYWLGGLERERGMFTFPNEGVVVVCHLVNFENASAGTSCSKFITST